MLSRPATKLSLNADDIAAYEQRKAAREAAKNDAMDDSKASSQEGTEVLPASAAKPAKSKMTREQRIGVGSSRA